MLSAPLLIIAAGLSVASVREIRRDTPCKGCLLMDDGSAAKEPLIVVLHGDEGTSSRVASVFRAIAEEGLCRGEGSKPHPCKRDEAAGERRAVRVLAPLCPKSQGCQGSFWRWEGDPKWLFDQIDATAGLVAVDLDRVYFAGWSGGSTYLGLKMPAWFERAAAVSIAGGGAPPRAPECMPRAAACGPIHFMMGDKNPLFDFAERLHRALVGCGHEVQWELLPGADHGGEWRAYERRAPEIVWWLLDRARGCDATSVEAPPLSSAPSATGSSPSAEPARSPLPVPERTAPNGPGARGNSGCSCEVHREVRRGRAGRGAGVLAIGFGVLGLSRRRRARRDGDVQG